MNTQIKNAVIESTSIDTGRGGMVTIWLHLKYNSGSQGFGGHALYLAKDYTNHSIDCGFAGHFIYRCMEIAGVEKWEQMKGKTIRVKATDSGVEEIGHIIKEDWFNPLKDFKTK